MRMKFFKTRILASIDATPLTDFIQDNTWSITERRIHPIFWNIRKRINNGNKITKSQLQDAWKLL